jgi:hypothetical protein
MKKRCFLTIGVLVVTAVLGSLAPQPVWAGETLRPARGTGDDDGYGDLAVGVSGENTDGGAVHVFYTDGGYDFPVDDTSAMDFWYQGFAGLYDTQEDEDRFGYALATGDFNGDYFTDLAVGVPYETISLAAGGTALYAGAVHIILASPDGLTSSDDYTYDMDDYRIGEDAQVRDFFGEELAAGDFNGDGYIDLAIGVPRRDVGGEIDAGMVQVIYGADFGIYAGAGEQSWFQNDLGNFDVDTGDNFGYALATGDFNGDGYDDLAIGAPLEDFYSLENIGAVHVIYGTSSGLTATDAQVWYQSDLASDSMVGDVADNDMFGYALTSGDFDADGYADLVIGVPGEDLGSTNNFESAGVAHEMEGGASGLTDSFSTIISLHPDHYCSSDIYAEQDLFGRALTAGDFDGDGDDDLAIGAPYADVDSTNDDAGSVYVFYSMLGILCFDPSFGYTLNQESPAIQGGAEDDDHYGAVLAAGDIDHDGCDDLIVGIPDEDISTVIDAGGVNVIYGQRGTQWDSQVPVDRFLDQSKGVIDTQYTLTEVDDHFGAAVALLDVTPRPTFLPLIVRD